MKMKNSVGLFFLFVNKKLLTDNYIHGIFNLDIEKG